MPINGSNMETLARLDEAAEHYSEESKKAEAFAALKAQIARVRAALAQLDEVLCGTPGLGS